MNQLPFNLGFIEFLAANRSAPLTALFSAASFLGEIEGYILVATLVYVAFDKRLAVRLTIIVLAAMSLNHVLKTLIANPRPFIAEGTHLENWVAPRNHALELAREYSTPSGHGMAAGAFYSYLYACVRNRSVRIGAILAILVTGLSRPYLGVHYLEDILLGWVIGIPLGLAAAVWGETIAAAWARLDYRRQVAFTAAASAAIWLFTVMASGWRIEGQPRAFLAYFGLLTGVIAARPLELKLVGFDARSGGLARKTARFVLSAASTIGAALALGWLSRQLAEDISPVGYALQYLRYVAVGLVGIFLAPLLFTRLGLANRNESDRAGLQGQAPSGAKTPRLSPRASPRGR